jgi:hypothetical protein
MKKRGTERELSPEGNGQHGSEAKGAGSAVDRDRRRAMIRVLLREAERNKTQHSGRTLAASFRSTGRDGSSQLLLDRRVAFAIRAD